MKKNSILKTLSFIGLSSISCYTTFDLISSQSLKSLLLFFLFGYFSVFVMYFFKHKKDAKYSTRQLKEKVAYSSKGYLLFCAAFIFSSLVMRLWSIKIADINFEYALSALLNDFYGLFYVFPIVIGCYFYNILFSPECEQSNNRKPNIYIYLSIFFTVLLGFLWGWTTELGRFLGLELWYVKDIGRISFDPTHLIIALILCALYWGMFVRAFGSQKKPFFLQTNCLLISPFLLLIAFIPLRPLKVVWDHYEFLDQKQEGNIYRTDYDNLLKAKKLNANPIQFFIDHGVTEFLRVTSFSWSKKLSPFVQRPAIQVTDEVVKDKIYPLLEKNEKIKSILYPAFRSREARNDNQLLKNKKPNVVIIVLESFETADSDSFSEGENPFAPLDALMKESVVFSNCFANSQASYEGESAVSMSLPIWGVINAKSNGLLLQSYTRSYLNILKDNGYNSLFVTTWDSYIPLLSNYQMKIKNMLGISDRYVFSNVDYYTYPFVASGIQNITRLFNENLDKSELDPNIHENDREFADAHVRQHGDWFVHDEYSYEKLYRTMISQKEPFFLVTHTESSHCHFPIPRKTLTSKRELTPKERYRLSNKYASLSLKEFFDKVKKHPVYENTIFILVSDHTNGTRENPLYDRYHIPLVIHCPSLLKPQVVDAPIFQIDIGPTLLNLLDLKGDYTTFGVNALKQTFPSRGMILPDWDGFLVFVYDDYIVKLDMNTMYEIYNYKKDKHKNLINDPAMKGVIDRVFKEFLITYTLFSDTLYSNKIAPEKMLIK